jgi:hypothetical protein
MLLHTTQAPTAIASLEKVEKKADSKASAMKGKQVYPAVACSCDTECKRALLLVGCMMQVV